MKISEARTLLAEAQVHPNLVKVISAVLESQAALRQDLNQTAQMFDRLAGAVDKVLQIAGAQKDQLAEMLNRRNPEEMN